MLHRAHWLLRMIVLLVVLSYFGSVLYVGIPITNAITVPLKGSVCCLSLPHEDMHFQTANGLTLSGWYIPPQNGALIILLHSYYLNRLQTLPVAKMLAKHGYGVLMYDQRASGQSEGEFRSLGWLDIPDVSKAILWAQSQTGVDKNRIGIYGCSTGGAIALVAAAQNPAIAAVAADAASPLTFDEGRPTWDDPLWGINFPVYILYYTFIALRAQTLPSMPTRQAAHAIAPRPLLLISTGEAGERERVAGFYDSAGEPKTHWNIPEAGHCVGPSVRPEGYEQHLVDFFDEALLKK